MRVEINDVERDLKVMVDQLFGYHSSVNLPCRNMTNNTRNIHKIWEQHPAKQVTINEIHQCDVNRRLVVNEADNEPNQKYRDYFNY